MKKTTGLILALVFILALAGCGLPDYSAVGQSLAGGDGSMSLTFVNGTGYALHEIFIFSASAGSQGSDLLEGITLGSGEAAELTLPAAESGEYTLLMTDNEYYEYSFTLLPLQNGGRILVRFTNETPAADVFNADDMQITTVYGTREESGRTADSGATGADTGGAYTFTLNNQSGNDFYSVSMGVPNAEAGPDIGLLPAALLQGESIELAGTVPEAYWAYTEWTLYITDAAGNTFSSPETFNPWAVSGVTVYWSSELDTYTCEFV